ncbi:hypothetical protein CRENBAI_012839 [Crenichthys baileyi]|uniref:VWFA domain-containing protein n=1 Tax=Crenichthys baileyi TaxID=28760 RepID=A0AAV9RJZ7_9TELE
MKMRRHRLLPLCALLGVLFAGLPLKLDAQEAPDSADLIFLIDGSQNVGAANFPYVRDWVTRVIERLSVGRDEIRVALVQYDNDPEIKFFLNSYYEKSSVLEAVKGLTYSGGDESNLGAALEEVAESLLRESAGGRAEEGAPQVLVIISATVSSDDTGAGHRALTRASVVTLGVPIGDDAAADLEEVATDKSFVLKADSFRTLTTTDDPLIGYITGLAMRSIIFHNEFNEVVTVGRRDIIFLIDSTMGTAVINTVREFIRRFVSPREIGPDAVQVGIAQFTTDPRLVMDLNSHGTKESLIAGLTGLRPRQGQNINIGAALNFVKQSMLKADKGSRLSQGVPQLVLLIVSKKSSDGVEGPAQALQRMGVLTLAAGSRAAAEEELNKIAFSDRMVFMAKDFRQLFRNGREITDALSTLSGTVVIETPTDPVLEITTVQTQRVFRDIVFLVDGSNYIGSNNLPFVRDLMINIVNQLDISPDRVQIGLMQFAEQPRIEFYLNTYNNKQDVVDKISQLRLTGGSVLNTGAAMNYAMNNMFQTTAGSRKLQKAVQVLILITGGPPQDNARSEADRLALEKILTFTVSSGQADEEEMQKIAFVPNLAYHERSFSDLPAMADVIMPSLMTTVGDIEVDETDVLSGAERDVAFLIDGTDSVRADFPYIRDFILKVIEPLDIGIDRVRVTVVQHSERPTPVFYLNTYQTKEEVIRAVRGMSLAGGRSLNTGAALRYMKAFAMSDSNGSRAAQNVPQFLIVLAADRSMDSVKEPAGELKTDGVVPFGVGVKNADKRQIEAISHNPSFAFNVKEFSELGTIPPKVNTYVTMPKEQLAVTLQQVQNDAVKRDIVFLLDGSDNTRDGFTDIKRFVKLIVEHLYVDKGLDRVSVVQFADSTKVNFHLNSHKTKNDNLNAIDNLAHKGGRQLNVGAALQFVRHRIFTSSMGSRRLEGVPQILIILTSKPSADSVKGPAFALQEHEIVAVGVGVGDAYLADLEMIAFKPGFIYKVTDFSKLYLIQTQVLAALNIHKDNQEAENGISDLVVDPFSNKRDIVFLLDGSDDSRNGLPAFREFVRRMAEELDVGEGRVRLAVVQYSNDATAYFNLRTHKTKKAVIYAIRALRHKGGKTRNTGAALQFVQNHVFSASSGSRHLERIPQVLVLLSGGASSDDVSRAALNLKQFGVFSFAIGMKTADQEELEKISSSSRFLFYFPVFSELLSIQPEVAAFIKTKIQTQPPSGVVELESPQRDIVFLLDGSDDALSGFPAMKTFVQQVVETLSVGENKDRVSVVQYSQDQQTHFSLNTYMDKQDVLNAVRQLNHKGGQPRNTGAALDHVRRSAFAESSGSRSKEGVPQILILLTGGRSREDVTRAAADLKKEKVVPFCVGTKTADILELQTIAHNPSYAFSVLTFDDIGSIHQQLVSLVKRVPRQQLREKALSVLGSTQQREFMQRDIVFLLDSSDEMLRDFILVRGFVEQMVEKLNVDERQDQVSVVQYSNEPSVEFLLNTYKTQQSVADRLKNLSHKGGSLRNTGAALNYIKENVFTTSSGSRHQQGVLQTLVLLTSGRSSDDVRNAVENLKETGVMMFVVGIKNADILEMQSISQEASHAYLTVDSSDMSDIEQQILSSIEKSDKYVATTVSHDPSSRDVVFLIDGSDDSQRRFPDIIDFIQRLVTDLSIGINRDRVAVVQYSNTAEINFNLSRHVTKDDVLQAVYRLTHKGGYPKNIGAALQYVKDYAFTPESGSRIQQGAPQILILLSGGRSADDIRTSVKMLKEMGVTIVAIGTSDADTLELQTISHEPKYALSVTDYEELSTVKQDVWSLLREISHHVVHSLDFETSAPVEADLQKADIVFLLDGSDNMQPNERLILEFVIDFVKKLEIGPSKAQVALVQYSTEPTTNFALNTYSVKEDALNHLSIVKLKGGGTVNTGRAIDFVKNTVFTASSGSRVQQGVPQVLILASGKKSEDDVFEPVERLKNAGIALFAVGVNTADWVEMEQLAPGAWYFVKESSDFPVVRQQVSSVTATFRGSMSPGVVDTAKKDIVFLLDGSDGTRNGFPAMRDFVEKVVEKLNVGENKDRVSVVQFSRDAEVHFYLNTYNTREDIVDAVRGLRHRGGRPLNTGAALQYVRGNVFTNASGSRHLQGVPQMLILLTGGRSFDNVDAPASALKQQGIIVIGIGTRTSDNRELQKLSYEPDYALSVSEFTDLPSVQEQLSSVMSTVLVRATTLAPTVTVVKKQPGRDVVFLLDGSDGTRTGFPAMQDFVQRVVETLSVDDNKDRVSVVQYSRDPAVQFYLNTYMTKGQILDAVRGLRHKGGRPLNTGAALQYLRDNVFTTSAGSRQPEGVPQVLILLSGGRSFDSVDAPAAALKQMGVLIFAIGSGGSDSRELQKVSHDPSYALSVSEFTDLPSVQQQLQASVEAVVIEVTPESPTVHVDTAKKDIVFLLDGSDGTRNGFPAMRDFVEKVVEKLNVGENKDRVSVVQFSRDAEVHFYLNTYNTREDIVDAVRGLRHRGGRPLNTGAALQYVRGNVFTNASGSRHLQGVPQMLILLTGGRSFDNVEAPASALKQQGIIVIGIGTRTSDNRELQKLSYEPDYALSVSEFTDLPSVQEQLSSVMSTVLVRATTLAPTVTVVKKQPGRDVVFLLDGSDGTRTGFSAMRDFVQRVVETLSVDDNKDRVSVVQYSRDPAVQFYLNTYMTKGQILDAVRGLRHKGGRPLNTGAALQYLRDNVFTTSAGSRQPEGVPQVLILLSGGRSFDSVDAPAAALKQMGVLIFAIGSGGSDSRELQKVSHDPSYALSVSEFTDLPSVQQQLQASVEAVVIEVTPESPTVHVDTAKKDIVFLLDGSDGTRNGFPAMRDFVEKVVEKLNVGENKDRVSVVQFSRDAEVHFYLNTYNTREDIVDAVRGLRHRGGRPLNTGAALQYVRGNVFTNASGSRHLQGVPQMLILLTGGRSFDNVDAPASALKQQGIIVIGIGTRTSDNRELQKLSYEPDYALSVSEFTDLPSVQEQLSSVMSTVLVRATPLAPTVTVVKKQPGRDVVFLLDGSDGTRTGFSAMRDFVQRVVETLSVDDNKDRVSVVQYSRDPAVQFYLNTYMTKGQILDAVRGLRHKGGRPLNTGAALQYLRDNVFTTSAGSRQPEGVPQVLILLSGGRSFDSVDAPAAALKQMGVLIFAIGSGGSDSRELQKVSHDPSYALSVSEFTDLPSVQQQLQASVEAVVIEVTPESPTVHVDTAKKDIVFLLDGSDGTRNGFPAMRDFVEKVVEKLNVGENKDRVSVVQFSRDAEVHFYLNTYNTREDIVDAVRGLRHRGGRPLNTGAALQYVRGNVFTNASGSRHLQGVPQMLILLTGGRSFDNVDAPASALKQQGIIVIGIGTRTSDNRELQKLSYEPDYALSVSEFTDLPSVQEQLSSVMSTVLVKATSMAPTVTVVKKQPGRDVVFLLDGSDGTRTGFPAMQDFVQRVVETLSVDDNKDRVSVVQYSRDPAVQFYLNTYMTKGQILDAVRGLRHKGGRPLNTGAALQYLRDNVFTTSAGSRQPEGVPQVLILLSGGRSFDSVDAPAAALKQMGVLIFAIGSGGSDSRELQKVSHDPSYALSVSEFTDLPSVQQQLQASVEAVVIEVTPESPTVHVDTAKKDIVFLLDGSDGTRNGFPAMRDFVEKVVEKLNVGENKDRVSVVQFSRDAEVHFYLNTYNTREDIVDAVRGLRHRGGRPLNTGAALQYVRGNVFTNASGSRHLQGVPQMLILLTGGRSFDNVDAPASALKQQGIIVIGIGTRTSDNRELQKLSYEPDYALSVSEFTDLPSVQEQLSSVMSTVLVRATPLAPTVTVVKKQPGRDVVFLVDGSDGTRTGFSAMRGFVQRVVETLSVDDNKDRVSVVQYSRDPAVQFYLNTYMTKGQILDAVRGLRHKGGRPLNTGAALQYLRDNVFTTSAGSRQPEGVPQVLILLSGGRSFDSVDAPAAALKQMGVLIFAIGSGGSDSRELQKVSHDPSYALSVSEFTDLPSVQQQLQASVEAVVIEVTPESPTVHVDTAKKDIVFLLDGSDGTRNGFPAMRDFVEKVVEKLNVGENKDRVSVVQFSRDAEVHFYLNTYNTREDIVDAVRGLRHRGGRPLNTGAALQYVRGNVFTNASGSRHLQGVPQMLILLTGGRSFDNVDAPASALKQQGIIVIGIGTRTSDNRELQKLSYEPDYALSVSEFTDLPSVQEQLSSVMSTVLVKATSMAPTVTVVKKQPGRDVVFLLDGSDGTRTGFSAMRDFVQRVVETLSVDDNKDRVSVVQYSRDPAVQFYLNTYMTKGQILDAVRGLRHKGGRPLNTGAALQYLRDNVFTTSAGSRQPEGVPQVLILLSGGRSFDSVDAPAAALKQMGVLIFAIGSGGSDSRELQKVSHDPSYALSVSEFTDLPSVQQQLQASVEAVVIEVTPESPTVHVDTAKKDIVFLLDGSDGTRNGFPAMRDFVEKVVEKLNVGENKDRVSVVQFSRDAEVHFYLNTYNTREDIVDAVRGLRHRGGRPLNTGAALQYVRGNVFTNASGSRHLQGVPQMLILLTGGRSFDNVDAPASALKQQGIIVIGIGTRTSDNRELQKLSYEPDYALSVSEFTDLPSVQEQLSSVMSTVLVRATSMAPTVTVVKKQPGRDVVFLVDGSDGTRTGFSAMRGFVQRVVETLSVDDNKDRVSVVQYSRDPAVQFYLNTYMTKGQILDAVRGLRHKGGRPLNTGAALQYLRDNVFTTSAGSRQPEGVPQVLILLSGGRSFDSVDAPAAALKQMGVLIFAIGSGGSDSRELQKVSHDPSYALSVSEFTDLPSVQQQLQASVEAVVIEVTPESPTVHVDTAKKDIVFLLDGSDGTRNGFPAMRDFVEKVVEKLNVGENKDRVSVVQFSRDAEVHFYLNTYNTREDIVDAVRGLRHRGGDPSNGAALHTWGQCLYKPFGEQTSARCPQMLILLIWWKVF